MGIKKEKHAFIKQMLMKIANYFFVAMYSIGIIAIACWIGDLIEKSDCGVFVFHLGLFFRSIFLFLVEYVLSCCNQYFY
jgi:hypothetical protein